MNIENEFDNFLDSVEEDGFLSDDLQKKLEQHEKEYSESFKKNFNPEIICPICGDSYVHLSSVCILTGQDSFLNNAVIIKSANNSTAVENINTYNRNRNLSVLLDFCCENGHVWSKYTGASKGRLNLTTAFHSA